MQLPLTLFHPYIVLFPQLSRQTKHFSLCFVVFPMAPRPNPRRLHPAHPYCVETNARASSWRATRTQYLDSSRLGSLVEAPQPDRNILVLVDVQDLQDLAHPRHPDRQECSPIRSTFFSNATGIEEQALFLWAQQHTPASDGDMFQVNPSSTVMDVLVHTITCKIYTYNRGCRELWVNQVNNNGLSRLREPENFFFFGSPEIIPCLFDFLIAGVSSLIFTTSTSKNLPLLISLKMNFQWRLLLLPQLFLHFGTPVDSVALWPIGIRYYIFCSCYCDHQWHSCKPTNYRLLLRDCRLWHHGALLTLVLLRQLHRFP